MSSSSLASSMPSRSRDHARRKRASPPRRGHERKPQGTRRQNLARAIHHFRAENCGGGGCFDRFFQPASRPNPAPRTKASEQPPFRAPNEIGGRRGPPMLFRE